MNSREKGKRGERQWRDELRANGYAARRGQQFAGSPESPDVVCDSLSWIHFEVKAVERLRIHEAMDQAARDSRGSIVEGRGSRLTPERTRSSASLPKSGEGDHAPAPRVPIVVHKRNFRLWLVTMDAETFFKFLRGDLPPQAFPNPTQAPLPTLGSGAVQAGPATMKISAQGACPGQQPQQEEGNEKENV